MFLEEAFDGAEFSTSRNIGARLKYSTIPSEGVSKSLKITDDDGRVIWNKQLKEQVFERGWLDDPTRVLVFTLNFVNIPIGLMLEAKIVV